MDDAKVRGYIRKAFQDWSIYTGVQRTGAVYNALIQRRRDEDPNDDNDELAAAEHYAYARWQIGNGTPVALMEAFTVGYDGLKVILGGLFVPRKYQPWTPPSYGSQKWGQKGCTDGMKDVKIFEANPNAGVTFAE